MAYAPAMSRIAKKYRQFTTPLPLNDFDGYDGYWEERGDEDYCTRWGIALEKIPDGATLLDVGCGTGAFLRYLTANRPHIDARGTDVSAKAVKIAVSTGLDAFVSDLTEDTLDRDYDYITCFETIEHIHEAERVLQTMRDATKKQLIMSLPNIGFVEHRIRLAAFGRFPNTSLKFHAKEHIRHWTVRDFTEWVGTFGLRVVQVEGSGGSKFYPWRKRPDLFCPQVVYTLERVTTPAS